MLLTAQGISKQFGPNMVLQNAGFSVRDTEVLGLIGPNGAGKTTLLAGWFLAWIPGLLALLLWQQYGGALYAPEVLNLLLGHLLRVVLSAGVAVAAAAISTGASSAAIATLGFTVGTWALEFIAVGRGGLLRQFASYTPTSALRVFEQGQFQLSTVAVTLTLGIAGFALAGIWLTEGRTLQSRLFRSAVMALVLGLVLWGSSSLRATWDISENRRNSFPVADEFALRQLSQRQAASAIYFGRAGFG